MAEFVIKKGGITEPFNIEKVRNSIKAASQRTNVSKERIEQVAVEVSGSVIQLAAGKKEITTSEIREKILTELDALEPAISEAWRKHDQEKGKV